MSNSIFTLPPTGFGPGSQPLQADDQLDYMSMPQGMRTYSQHTPEIDDLDRVPQGAALMRAVAEASRHLASVGNADAPPQAEPLVFSRNRVQGLLRQVHTGRRPIFAKCLQTQSQSSAKA